MSSLQIIGRRENFSLGSLGGKAAGDAAEKAAKEAAEKAAKKTAGEAAEKAAKEAAEKTAKEAAEKAAKEAGEKAAKEAAANGASEAGQKAAREAAEKSAKEAGEKAAKEASEKAAKEASEKAAKQSAEDATEKAAKEAAEKEGKDYAMYAAAAALAGIGLYTYGKGADEAEKSNNTPRGITMITSNTGTKYDVSYNPAIRILKADSMVISSSNTVPKIDGTQVVSSVIGDSKIVIDFGVTLTSNAAGGSIKVTTTPEDQAGADIADAAAAAAAAAKDVAGDFLSGILDTLGISADTFKWIGIVLGVICLLVMGFMFLK